MISHKVNVNKWLAIGENRDLNRSLFEYNVLSTLKPISFHADCEKKKKIDIKLFNVLKVPLFAVG